MAKERKLGRPADQRKALLRNQVSQLIWNGKITTTLDRARRCAPSRRSSLLLPCASVTIP